MLPQYESHETAVLHKCDDLWGINTHHRWWCHHQTAPGGEWLILISGLTTLAPSSSFSMVLFDLLVVVVLLPHK